MNRKLGFISSIILCGAAAVFLVCLIVALFQTVAFTENLSYLVCMVLAWSWVAAACVYSCYADREKQAAAKIGIAIGVMYATLISVVYYTQLTVVLYESVDKPIVDAFRFASAGSWLFAIDLLGYGLLSLSTFFVGLTIDADNKKDRALKRLLLIHGAFCVCMIFPILPLPPMNEGLGGVIALIAWCAFFLPICILSILHFKDLDKNRE